MRHLGRTGVVCVLAAALLGAGSLWFSPVSYAREGARPASFSLPAIPGGPTHGTFRLADHLGKDPIVILFWATWCAPCQKELPLYQKLYERYHDEGLQVVAISMDGPNTVAQSGPLARRLGISFPVLSDLDTSVTGRLNPRRAAPFTVWIGRNGRIVHESEGFSLSDRKEIARGVIRLVRKGK